MKVMQLWTLSQVVEGAEPLQEAEIEPCTAAAHEVLLKVRACEVCRNVGWSG